MKLKKLLAPLLALAMVFALCACGGPGDEPVGEQSESPNQNIQYTDEAKEFTIGFLGSMFGTGQDLTVKNYIENVLLPNLPNVTAVYSTAFYNIEDEKTALEDLITQGADGIVVVSGMYDMVGLLETCADADVYLACAVSAPSQDDMDLILEDEALLKYFIGMSGVSIKDEFAAGEKIAQAAIDLSKGGTVAVLGMQGFVKTSYQYQRLEGVRAALGDLYDENLFFNIEWGDGTMTLGSDLLAQGPAAVATTTAGADILCGLVSAKKLTDSTQVAAIGYIDKSYQTFFNSGALDYCEAVYGEYAAGAFILMYNWLNNGLRWSSEMGNFAWCELPCVSVPDAASMTQWLEYCGTADKSPFSIDDVKSLLVQYNHDATYEQFVELMQAVDMAAVQGRRG